MHYIYIIHKYITPQGSVGCMMTIPGIPMGAVGRMGHGPSDAWTPGSMAL